jgi:hypothetical protein
MVIQNNNYALFKFMGQASVLKLSQFQILEL